MYPYLNSILWDKKNAFNRLSTQKINKSKNKFNNYASKRYGEKEYILQTKKYHQQTN